ncbi:MAG: peptide chain release factor 2 [Myxococcales bacterium]|nr:peptide chain release factor 2 [Myxococcales bacterium]
MRFGSIFDIDRKLSRLSELDEQSASAEFWESPEKAQVLLKERTTLQELINGFSQPLQAVQDALILAEMAEEENDETVLSEVEHTLNAVARSLEDLEFQRMFSTSVDASNAIVSINSGAGGLDAQDWAQMLERMYLRWCDRHGFKVDLADEQEGDEAGIKSATFAVEGKFAYGYLRAEAGVHRLVRISPFDANARRHTSFASVFVYPDIDDSIEVTIIESDLRVDTYRASGAGGQHVNRTDSAVRITHIPTGIVVQCQNERSQHKNRSTAMKILRSRLYALQMEQRKAEADALNSEKKDIDFGSQIRSYVIHPYRIVKDHRTGYEVGNTDAVLDGDLDGFMRAYLLATGADSDQSSAEGQRK